MPKIKKQCEICGETFEKWPSYFVKRAGRFCSNKCKLIDKSKEWTKNNPMKYIDNSGKNNPMWGKIPKHFNPDGNKRGDGYVRITVNGKRVLKHRYLIEKALGRKLMNNEIIHHLDGNNENNEIDNLSIINQSQHINLHRLDLMNGRMIKGGVKNHHLSTS